MCTCLSSVYVIQIKKTKIVCCFFGVFFLQNYVLNERFDEIKYQNQCAVLLNNTLKIHSHWTNLNVLHVVHLNVKYKFLSKNLQNDFTTIYCLHNCKNTYM